VASLSRRRLLTLSDVALAVLYTASLFGFVRSQRWPGAGLLWLPALASLGFVVDGVGAALRRRGERNAWTLAGLGVALGAAWTIYPVMGEQLVTLARGVIGSGLALMGAVFLAGRPVWRPERGLVPMSLGLLVVAGLDPLVPLKVPFVIAVTAVLGYLALDSPTRRRPEAARGSRLLPLALMTAAMATVALGLAFLLPRAQPAVEAAVGSAFTPSSAAYAGMGPTSRLGEIETLALDRRVVMRVWAERPVYLRARVHTEFDGRRWKAAAEPPRPLALAEEPLAAELAAWLDELPGKTWSAGAATGRPVVRTRILLAEPVSGPLFSRPVPRLVRLGGGTPRIDGFGALHAGFWPPPVLYGVVHGEAAPAALPAEVREACLRLPAGLDRRILDLASRLGEGTGSGRERLDRTFGWLGRECRYSLDVGRFRSTQPVAEFLFEKKRGYCEYFATAAALLLRLQGVPTRFVAGFNVREANVRGGHYLVRASDAHAWVEAHVDGEGWIEADPTPPDQYDALRAEGGDGWLARTWEAVAAPISELLARFGHDWAGALGWLGRKLTGLVRQPAVAIPLVAVAAGFGLRRLWSRRRLRPRRAAAVTSRAAVSPELAVLLERLERRLSALGHPRPPHLGPLEHLGGLSREAVPASLLEAGERVVACYYAERFGDRPSGPAELAHLAATLARADTH